MLAERNVMCKPSAVKGALTKHQVKISLQYLCFCLFDVSKQF